MSERKYEKLVYQFKPEYNEAAAEGAGTDFVYSPQAYFRGASQIPGSKFNMGFQIFVKPFFLDRIPHRHPVDEYLIFLGGTFPNVFDFDAEISLCMGEEMEEYIITQPTIVRIPAGLQHCPLNFKRIDKPVFFQADCMQGMFGGIYDGKELYYNGPGNCIYDDNKKCDACRKCLEDDWDK
jgi:mannose-6-phosphate isomerase-like protein (cupin superfamily)